MAEDAAIQMKSGNEYHASVARGTDPVTFHAVWDVFPDLPRTTAEVLLEDTP